MFGEAIQSDFAVEIAGCKRYILFISRLVEARWSSG